MPPEPAAFRIDDLVQAVYGVPFPMPLPALIRTVEWKRRSLTGTGWTRVRDRLGQAVKALDRLQELVEERGEMLGKEPHPAFEALRLLNAAQAAFTDGQQDAAQRFGPVPPGPWAALTPDTLDPRYRW